MSIRELAAKLDLEATYVAATVSGAAGNVDSAAVAQGAAKSVTHIVNVGQSGDTLSASVSLTFLLIESDDNVTYTAVDAADVNAYRLNTLESTASIVIDAAAEDETALKFAYKGSKPYTKLRITKTGTHTNGTPVSVVCVKEPEVAPAV